MRIVLVGIGILPFRTASDKNFFLALRAALADSGADVHMVSIAEPSGVPSQDTVHFIARPFHARDTRHYKFDEAGRPVAYHHVHRQPWQSAEVGAALVAGAGKLRGVRGNTGPTVWHWTDSPMGLPFLRLAVGRDPIVASALSYTRRSRMAERTRAAALGFADAVVTGSGSARESLLAAGCRARTIEVVPWGCDEPPTAPAAARGSGEPVRFLWSGFIQRIGEKDLLAALELARTVARQRSDVHFTFCLKPESYRPVYAGLAAPRVDIVVGDSRFRERLAEYDALFSPLLDQGSALAPPLTWIEAWSAGVPVVTTRTPGIDEHTCGGSGGMVFGTWDGLGDWLKAGPIREDLEDVRGGAQRCFAQRYRIGDIAHQLLSLYGRIAE